MIQIKRTPQFDEWFDSLKDNQVKLRLIKRLKKVSLGNLGDVKFVGEGVWEMREHFGAGWRLYYVKQGNVLVVMLGGGDKSSQQKDIDNAIQTAKQLAFDELEQNDESE